MKKKIQKIVEEFLDDKPFFLVSIKEQGDRMTVLIDGYNGLNVSVCSRLSRFIQRKGEEDASIGDYSYEVSSPGIGCDINNQDQLKANVGRLVKLKRIDGIGHIGKMIGTSPENLYIKDQKEIIAIDQSIVEEVKVQVEI